MKEIFRYPRKFWCRRRLFGVFEAEPNVLTRCANSKRNGAKTQNPKVNHSNKNSICTNFVNIRRNHRIATHHIRRGAMEGRKQDENGRRWADPRHLGHGQSYICLARRCSISTSLSSAILVPSIRTLRCSLLVHPSPPPSHHHHRFDYVDEPFPLYIFGWPPRRPCAMIA